MIGRCQNVFYESTTASGGTPVSSIHARYLGQLKRSHPDVDNDEIGIELYTQLTDVEQEINGLLTYDRKPKVPLEVIKTINQGKLPQ